MKFETLEAISKALAPVIKQFVSEAQANLRKDFEAQLEAIRKGIPKTIELCEIESIVESSVETKFAAVPKAKDGESVVLEDVLKAVVPQIQYAVTNEIEKNVATMSGLNDEAFAAMNAKLDDAINAIEPPKDGKSLYLDDVAPSLKEMVDEAVAKIPAPKDGSSVTIEDISPLMDKAFAEMNTKLEDAINSIEPPKDGKSLFLDDVIPWLKEAVDTEIAKIPVPKDGKSVTIEDVSPLIDKATEQLIEKNNEYLNSIELPKDGKDGDDGLNAIDIEILPDIDEEKSYARNTYAAHKGGLWRSFEKTFGMRGWECIVNGVAEAKLEQHDERSAEVSIELSDGRLVAKKLEIPAVVYKGVYRKGTKHFKGDMLTYGGSTWHCNEDTETCPGEHHKEWTLAVKKGRDYSEPTSIKKIDPKAPVKIK